jgi:hypothetical protein
MTRDPLLLLRFVLASGAVMITSARVRRGAGESAPRWPFDLVSSPSPTPAPGLWWRANQP